MMEGFLESTAQSGLATTIFSESANIYITLTMSFQESIYPLGEFSVYQNQIPVYSITNKETINANYHNRGGGP
jgi:hypothetical protein